MMKDIVFIIAILVIFSTCVFGSQTLGPSPLVDVYSSVPYDIIYQGHPLKFDIYDANLFSGDFAVSWGIDDDSQSTAITVTADTDILSLDIPAFHIFTTSLDFNLYAERHEDYTAHVYVPIVININSGGGTTVISLKVFSRCGFMALFDRTCAKGSICHPAGSLTTSPTYETGFCQCTPATLSYSQLQQGFSTFGPNCELNGVVLLQETSPGQFTAPVGDFPQFYSGQKIKLSNVPAVETGGKYYITFTQINGIGQTPVSFTSPFIAGVTTMPNHNEPYNIKLNVKLEYRLNEIVQWESDLPIFELTNTCNYLLPAGTTPCSWNPLYCTAFPDANGKRCISSLPASSCDRFVFFKSRTLQ